METVITKNIDDHIVVVGFGRLLIDPEASKRQRSKILEKNDEYKKLVESGEVLREAKDKVQIARNLGKPHKKLESAVTSAAKAFAACVPKVAAVAKTAHEKGTVHFECRQGEVKNKDSEKLRSSHAALEPNQALLLDGTVVPDYRGVVYYTKKQGRWTNHIVKKIGERIPGSGVTVDELTNQEQGEIMAQEESDRIAALSAAARAKELESKLTTLAESIQHQRSLAEIRGESDTLKKYQTEYKRKAKQIEAVYD